MSHSTKPTSLDAHRENVGAAGRALYELQDRVQAGDITVETLDALGQAYETYVLTRSEEVVHTREARRPVEVDPSPDIDASV